MNRAAMFAACALLGATALNAAGVNASHAQSPSSKIRTQSEEVVEYFSRARGHRERVRGYFNAPPAQASKYPLMVIMHSSGGVHERDRFFARTLNAIGVATLIIDSFTPRGLTKVSENKQSFGEREQAIDALSAIEAIMRKDARIDPTRIGAMGRSLGGQTAVRLSLKASRAQIPTKGPNINLAIAITPGCASQQQDRTMTPRSQAWLFLAEKDGSPYQRCITYVEKMRAAGGDARYKVYPNAFHTFDGSVKPVWTPNQEVYAGCENDRVRPGYSIRLDTGQALRTKKDWSEFFAGCVKRGMWVGGDPDATRDLDREWIAAVKKRWLGD